MLLPYRPTAYRSEEVEELRIFLAMLLGEIADNRVERLPCRRLEREARNRLIENDVLLIVIAAYLDRRKLEEITDEHKRESAEGTIIKSYLFAHLIDHGERVRREHRHLVDDENLRVNDAIDDVLLLRYLIEIVSAEGAPYTDTGPRVYGLSCNMRRSDSGRRSDGRFDTTGTKPCDVLINGMCLTAPGLSREEYGCARFQYAERLALGHPSILLNRPY